MRKTEQIHNCYNCQYANIMTDGDISCDRRALLDDIYCVIDAEKAELPCPSHSGIDFEENRADRPWNFNSQADDVCEVCHRRLKLTKTDTYSIVEVEYINEAGEERKTTVKKCSICASKGK